MDKDRKDLKIQALLERISSDKAKYEDEIANLRVELTITSQQVQELSDRLNEPDTFPENPEEDSPE